MNFINSLREPLNKEFVDVLNDLNKDTPEGLKPQFACFINKVSTTRVSDGIYRQLFAPDFSHENLCKKLNLSKTDRDLLAKYNIDLLNVWNCRHLRVSQTSYPLLQ